MAWYGDGQDKLGNVCGREQVRWQTQFEKRSGVNWPNSQLNSLNGMSTVAPPLKHPYRLMSPSVSRGKEREHKPS